MLADSHCHLDGDTYGGDDGVDAALGRARAAGVTLFVAVGSGTADGQRSAVSVAARHPDVWCAVGLHPHDAKMWDPAFEAELVALAKTGRVVALGEMGLDFHYDLSPRDVQRDVLAAEVRLARALDLPVIVHDREAGDETFEIVRANGGFEGPGALWHCFTGDRRLMGRIVDAGGTISIPGIVTFKNAGEMREVAREVPADRLLVETDSPFLTPIPFRGQRNEPAHVALVAAKVAELRGISVEQLAAVTGANTRRFFRITAPAG
jgi:TatD DNase family protein